MSTVPPIRREVLVDAGPEAAFDVFTAGIGRWWPIAELSVHGSGGTVAFTGGQIVERSATGQQAVWGTVTRWEPPAAVAFTWHPGQTPERESHVEVTFTAAGPQTLVTVIHTGWDVFADPAAARAEYDHGWPVVLGRYQEQAGRPARRAATARTVVSAGRVVSARRVVPARTGASRLGWRCCTARARPHHRTDLCLTTPASLSMSRSSTGCAKPAISSPPAR